ncbi:alpha/beta hydrolase [Paenibacillus sp. YIM B09110]|uniref:alpha/beta hydrolase n=1 Tax=Paenibacillus sp. YIM B09110 TaxID=3126102 RepID=UPI00301CAC76
MDFTSNREILDQVIRDRESIRPIATHRKADGSIDVESNLRLWNTIIVKFKQIQLWEAGAPDFDESFILQPQPSIIFIPSPLEDVRGTVIVAHGGGFEIRTGSEGFHTADFFNKMGFNVAILTYRLKPYTRFDAIADMQRAVRILRSRADELHISNIISVMGFSAGGMLSANCGTHFDNGQQHADDPVDRYSCRPDAVVVGYGAFSFAAFSMELFTNVFTDPNRAETIYLSPDKNISAATPPFFIWQTNPDDPRFSLNLAKELTDAGVPFELHCFPDGPHGVALADGNNDMDYRLPHLMHWSELCAEWLEGIGL